MKDRTLRRLAWVVAALIVAGVAASVILAILTPGGGAADPAILLFLLFPVVGVVLALRRPRNPLGWLMLGVGIAISLPLDAYGRFAVETGRPFGPVALVLSGPTWVPFIGLAGFLLLLFPDGHLPSPRWRWFAWVCGVGMIVLVVLFVFIPGSLEDMGYPRLRNPLGIDALGVLVPGIYGLVAVVPLAVAGGAVSLVVRSRRTRDDVQRHQIRWVVWSAALVAISYALAFIPGILGVSDSTTWNSWIQVVGVLSFVLIPITIGVAVLRYRLYDIDVVIRKTVVFTVLAIFITLVYVGVVVGVGALVGARSDPALSAAAAAVVALVFQPVRRGARRVADRVVYGRRATPYEVLAEFSERLGDTYAADDVLVRMARIVGEGVGATRAEVWLRIGERDRLAAVWPHEAEPGASPDGADAAFPVTHHGETLGSLAVAMPANDPMNPERTRVLNDLAAQAGLVLRNVRLTEELRARLEDLRAAQKRLVSAQDAERKRIERNIHDGAQQLVALAVKIRLADAMVERDPTKAHALLGELQAEASTALDDLRDLARGIYPPLLADQGLEAALAAQIRRAPVPVELRVDLGDRLPSEVEAAVYFACLECLQNVGKYAQASRASITVSPEGDDTVDFRVTDDGLGFDTTARGFGTGLQGIADRLGALDGTVEVRSAPGEGTTVWGRVPTSPG